IKSESYENGADVSSKKVTTASHEKNKSAKRFAYLLSLTDLFSHFLRDMIVDPEMKQLVQEHLQTHQARDKASGSRRHRKTEKEEDEELLKTESSMGGAEGSSIFTESPVYVKGGTMRDYQVQGLNWMISLYENGINGILADEMGLGKTLQTISFLGYLKVYLNVHGPHLIVVPKSTLHNWQNEFLKWVPELDSFILHGSKEERGKLITDRLLTGNFDCCITTYEMCLILKSDLKKVPWEYIIIDEAHRIKNENSSLSQMVRLFKSNYRLLITGTPLQNNLHELWALLNFLLPDVFRSSEDFDSWFESNDHGDQQSMVTQLHAVLRPFVLRRVKADVEHSLLPKKEINLYVGMSSMQKKWYQKILIKDIDAVNGADSDRKGGKTRLMNVAMHLRKCCNHPYLFDGAEPGPPFTTDEHLVDNAGKMVVLDKLLKRLKAQGSRVLIFSQMSRMLDILEDYCVFRDYQYCRIDGQTSHEDRVQSIDEYNKPGSEKFIFLLTTRAGGLGINLVTADTVIIYDSDWNPQVDLQAQDRAHRIGQTKQVYVFRFITENAIDEKVVEKASKKLRLDQLVIQQGRLSQQQKSATREDLLTMIQHGAEKIFRSDVNQDDTMNDADIDAILARGETKTLELNQKFQTLGLTDLQNFSLDSINTYEWEGEDYRGKRKPESVGLNWIQPAKRERKSNYSIDEYYREVMRVTPKTMAPARPPKPKQLNIHDFQFYPPELKTLLDKEIYHYRKVINYKVPPVTADNDEDLEAKEKEREEEQSKIDNAEPLSEDELALKERLSKDGFEHWSRRDFQAFVRGCERYGRKNLRAITEEIEGKTLNEVRAYSKVFWSRYKGLADHERIIANIEKGESRLTKQRETEKLLGDFVNTWAHPLQELKFPYKPSKGKFYTEDEDRFILVTVAQLGYLQEDVYERLHTEVRKSPLFKFDWFFKSRTPAELQRRCNTLIMMLQKGKSDPDDDVVGNQEKPKAKNGTARKSKN
ncbi:chromatin remodeling complex Adenosinetriphosphatase, partial [Dispira simplex]